MKHTIFAVALAAAALTACNNDPAAPGSKPGDGIQFSLESAPSTRTDWGGNEDGYQLKWNNGDAVSIASEQTTPNGPATYEVLNKEANKPSLYPMTSTQLNWGGSKPHTFYAVYPASNSTLYADGKATFSVKDQTCTLSSRSPENNVYTITSDPATNAFMVADTTVTPSNNVALHFQPITTTTRIVVNGPSGDGTQNRAILLTKLRIEYPGAFETFNYDIKTHKLIATESNTSDNSRKTLDVNIVDQNNKATYVNIGHDESAAFNVYLPPVNSDYKGDGTLKVTLLGLGKDGAETVLGTKSYKNFFNDDNYSGKKTRVNLPAAVVPTTADPSSWMSTMDDRIYINQLSIPGTHDTESTEEYMTSTNIVTGVDFAVTQTKPMEDQWAQNGARCFDMRVCPWGSKENPADKNGEGYESSMGDGPRLWTWHGVFRLRNSFEKEIETMRNCLKSSPGEFAIFLVKFENDEFLGSDSRNQKNRDASAFQQEMTNLLDEYKDLFIPWKPDLTVGDCRGKIVLLTRYNDETYLQQSGKFAWGWQESGYITGWPAAGMSDVYPNGEGSKSVLHTYSDNATGTLYLQDFCKYYWGSAASFGDTDGQKKVNSIIELLSQSGKLEDGTSLVINYLSAYWYNGLNGSLLGYEWPSTSRYADNAANVHQRIWNKVRDGHTPTGIMMMDHIGDNSNAEYGGAIDGQLMANVILQNNYKPNLVTLLRAK